MDPHCAITISGRLIAEFDDDASEFLSGKPEVVPVTSRLPVLEPNTGDLTPPCEPERRKASDQ